jgi:hypothetical protein
MQGEGLKGTTVDEGCSRVMKDRVKRWVEGKMESTEPSKTDVFIAGATPNKQLKNQVAMIIGPQPIQRHSFSSHGAAS